MNELLMKQWRSQAECRTNGPHDPDLFFPVGNSKPALLQTEQAKAVCNNICPVLSECIVWTFESEQDTGVSGGMSAGERRTLKQRHEHLAILATHTALLAEKYPESEAPDGNRASIHNGSGRS